jgi:hypothetical protein
MGWFKRNTKRFNEFDTGHRGDDELLGHISERSDLNTPRHWIHYLYFSGERTAREAAAEIKAGGWDIQATERAAQGPGWVVIAEKHKAITSPMAVREARAYFEGIASRINGAEYDGWEVSI